MGSHYRVGTVEDLSAIQQLAIEAWSPFQKELTHDNWTKLSNLLSDEETYLKIA